MDKLLKHKVIIVALVILLMISVPISLRLQKQPIHEATTYELEQVYGIGEVLGQRIFSYLQENNEASIDDLIKLDGVGEIKLNNIKKVFYD